MNFINTLKVSTCNSDPFPNSLMLILSVKFLTIDLGNSNWINILQTSYIMLCLNCNSIISNRKKYCSNKCQAEYQYKV